MPINMMSELKVLYLEHKFSPADKLAVWWMYDTKSYVCSVCMYVNAGLFPQLDDLHLFCVMVAMILLSMSPNDCLWS